MEEEKKNDKDAPKPNPLQIGLRIAAYPASVAAGLLFAHTTARDAILKRYEKLGAFESVDEQQKKEFQGRHNAPGTNGEHVSQHAEEVGGIPVPRHSASENRKYARTQNVKIDHAQRDFLIKEGFSNNMIHYWEGSSSKQRGTILINAFSAASVTLGLLLTVSDNKNFFKGFLDDKPHKKADASPSR